MVQDAMRPLLCTLVLVLAAGCGGNGGGEASGVAEQTPAAESEQTTATSEPPATGDETLPLTTEPGADEAVEEFVMRVNGYVHKGQYGRAYELLHPAQRDFMSAGEFADCLGDEFGLPQGASLKVAEVYDERWDIPGTKLRQQPSKAVAVLAVTEYEEEGETLQTVELGTFTQHVFEVEGEWAWIVSEDVVDDLKNDVC